MKKSKLIIIEGTRGAGKTTVANWIREELPYTNLYRLSGNKDANSQSKTYDMYKGLMTYIRSLRGLDINLVFDRIFISEYVYCNLGFKKYQFNAPYVLLMADLDLMSSYFDIYIIHMVVNQEELEIRLKNRGDKANYYGLPYEVENSMTQQEEYTKVIGDIAKEFPNIKVTPLTTEDKNWKDKLKEFLGGFLKCK